jgi:hypothetical protein
MTRFPPGLAICRVPLCTSHIPFNSIEILVSSILAVPRPRTIGNDSPAKHALYLEPEPASYNVICVGMQIHSRIKYRLTHLSYLQHHSTALGNKESKSGIHLNILFRPVEWKAGEKESRGKKEIVGMRQVCSNEHR